MPFVEATRAAEFDLWIINRPERGNGLGLSVAAELSALVAEAACAPPTARPLVLTAKPVVKGQRATWVAGGDLHELAELKTAADALSYSKTLNHIIEQLDLLPRPVIVAVDGVAIGGGAELALAGDLRFMSQASSLDFRQMKVGLTTGYGTTRRLVSLVGLSRTQSILLTSAVMTAEEAHAAHLVHGVAPDTASLWAMLATLCRELIQREPEAFAVQKRMLWQAARAHPGAATALELELFSGVWGNKTHESFLAGFRRQGPPQ